jgi:hypothetical protein
MNLWKALLEVVSPSRVAFQQRLDTLDREQECIARGLQSIQIPAIETLNNPTKRAADFRSLKG